MDAFSEYITLSEVNESDTHGDRTQDRMFVVYKKNKTPSSTQSTLLYLDSSSLQTRIKATTNIASFKQYHSI